MLTPIDRLELKGVTRLAVSEAGGQENCTNISRISRHGTFSDYGSPSNPEIIALDVAIDLDRFNGSPRLLGKAAELCGCLLVALPKGSNGEVERATARSAEEFGQMVSRILAALADRRITEAEATPILALIFELMRDLAGLAEAVKAKVEADR